MDHFSKWPEVIPLRNIESITIARAIYDQWICHYGIMKRLHSDGASNVHGSVIKELSTLLGIGKSQSSRLHPQGDGLSEAMVKQAKSCIQKQVDQYERNWDFHLQAAVYAIRSSISSSTKVSPAEMILGDKLSLPTQLLATNSPEHLLQPTTKHHIKQAQQFATDLGLGLKRTFDIVNQTLSESRTNMKLQYDKSTTKHHYKVDDTVMLWKPTPKTGISRCWQPKWSGPWKIVRLVGDVNCQLMNTANKLSPVVHVNQLKYIPKRANHLNEPLNTPQDVSTHRTIPQPCDVFSDLSDAIDHQEQRNDFVQEEGEGRPEYANHPIINENWCQLNVSNILPQRTRSNSMT